MDPPNPLEALRHRLALAVGENAVFDGWTKAAVDSAAPAVSATPGFEPTLWFALAPDGIVTVNIVFINIIIVMSSS